MTITTSLIALAALGLLVPIVLAAWVLIRDGRRIEEGKRGREEGSNNVSYR